MRKLEHESATTSRTEDALGLAREERDELERQLQIYAERLHSGEPEVIIVTKAEVPPGRSIASLAEGRRDAQAKLDGRILAVNRDYHKVIVSLGSIDGVKLADTLSVYRDKSFIGSVKAEKVEFTTCIASVMRAWRHVEFMENDEVER
jgi:hypothetical protein